MPIDPEVQRELSRLNSAFNGLTRRVDTLVAEVNQLKAANPTPVLVRLVEAANQVGQLLSRAEITQATLAQPKFPWNPT